MTYRSGAGDAAAWRGEPLKRGITTAAPVPGGAPSGLAGVAGVHAHQHGARGKAGLMARVQEARGGWRAGPGCRALGSGCGEGGSTRAARRCTRLRRQGKTLQCRGVRLTLQGCEGGRPCRQWRRRHGRQLERLLGDGGRLFAAGRSKVLRRGATTRRVREVVTEIGAGQSCRAP